MNEKGPSFWRRHRGLKWTMIVLLIVVVVLGTAISVMMRHAEPMLHAYIVSQLEEHFHARVELDSFHVSLATGLRAEGKGLRIWPPAEIDGVTVPADQRGTPLISLDDFRFRAPLHYEPGKPIHVSVVQLKGLTVDIPSKPKFNHEKQEPDSNPHPSKFKQALIYFQVGSMVGTDVRLILESSNPEKMPLEFVIASLNITDIQSGGLMKFQANLTNARPVGTILTKGTFGPWTVEDPGESPISGTYDFEHANLADFKGISGILSSTGTYQGPLRELTVDGVTDTPDFALTHFGNPMPLHTQFHAKVDGTNGDTWLDPVQATLGHSHFTVRGKVVGVRRDSGPDVMESKTGAAPPRKGHDIVMTVDIPRGRMEDFLRLTSKDNSPLMTGWLTMQSSLEIPPGEEPVHQRIKLKGTFSLDDAQFTDAKIQDRIAELSLRGQGRPKEAKNKTTDDAQVRSTMQSHFTMVHGVITLPDLKYEVPGADIQMSGKYHVDGGGLDFAGQAKMQATVSQMLGGWKGFLLKPADRFFKKDGAGTEVPIHVDGTRQDPHFGVDFGRTKKTSPERPNEKQ